MFVSAKLGTEFVGSALVDHPVVIDDTETQNINFTLNATNFDFSPSNDVGSLSTLSIDLPANAEWVIAPKSGASGHQVITLNISGLQDWIVSLLNVFINQVKLEANNPRETNGEVCQTWRFLSK